MSQDRGNKEECHLETVDETDFDNDGPDICLIIVGTRCPAQRQLKEALQELPLKIVYSPTGGEYLAGNVDFGKTDNYFVYDRFDDEICNKLIRAGCRVVGPPVVIKCSKDKQALPFSPRPLYCMSMQHIVLCFTGYSIKQELRNLVDLVHHMGGTIRREMSASVTHLVARHAGGESYRAAVGLGTCIMTDSWIKTAWELREDISVHAKDKQFEQFRMSPFFNCTLSFLGFTPDEQKHMEDLTVENGGSFVPNDAQGATHIVVDELHIKKLPVDLQCGEKVWIIKGEWFWGSIQMNACAKESIYRFLAQNEDVVVGPRVDRTINGSKIQRRRRHQQNLAVLAQEGEVDTPYISRQQSTELSQLSLSASLLDESEDLILDHDHKSEAGDSDSFTNKLSPRLQVVRELQQTERNYVGILETILQIRDSITDATQPGGAVLSNKEVQLIFGTLPPIRNVHVELRNELSEMVNMWSDKHSIGHLILKYAPDMTTAYPPFVNFFDQTKEHLAKFDKANPRFHAFLKRCQSWPECGRQTLAELMIRPVQRLPSVMLLLNDILKQTDKKSNRSEFDALSKAIAALKEVMTHINEDRRKTEGQVAMFDIMNDVENCPPHLLSAHRRLICKVNVVELSDELVGRGTHLTIFLFNDYLQVCKRKLRPTGTYRSPSNLKPYRHLELLSLPSLKRVVDIRDPDETKMILAVICRNNLENKETLYSFIVTDNTDKAEFLRCLCQQIANSTCRTDYESLLISMFAESLHIDTSDLNLSSFTNKIHRLASKTRKRVSRAFSVSFTQTPKILKRSGTTSSILDSGSPVSTTPRSRSSRLKVASSTMSLDLISNDASPILPSPVSCSLTPASRDEKPKLPKRASSMMNLLRKPSLTKSNKTNKCGRRRKSVIGSDFIGMFNTLRTRKPVQNPHYFQSPHLVSPILEDNDVCDMESSVSNTPNLSSALKRSITIGGVVTPSMRKNAESPKSHKNVPKFNKKPFSGARRKNPSKP